jgi:hypothetical protein
MYTFTLSSFGWPISCPGWHISDSYQTCCLFWGFLTDDGHIGVTDGTLISPESIEAVLQIADYEMFVTEMESRVHDAIPFGIAVFFSFFLPLLHSPYFTLPSSCLRRGIYLS